MQPVRLGPLAFQLLHHGSLVSLPLAHEVLKYVSKLDEPEVPISMLECSQVVALIPLKRG